LKESCLTDNIYQLFISNGHLVVVRGYCDGSRWRFDSSNAREL